MDQDATDSPITTSSPAWNSTGFEPDSACFDAFRSLIEAESDSRWFVLHTKSRQEKALAAALAARDIRCYLPLKQEVKYYGPRKTVVQEPLFPGYAFLWGTQDQAYWADRTRRVARVLPVADQHRLGSELRQIQLALSRNAPLTLYPALVKGIKVEVRSGPLRGLRGVIQDRRKNNRLILQVQMLAQAASLELDGAVLEPIE